MAPSDLPRTSSELPLPADSVEKQRVESGLN